jgi:hypothetical protein
MGNEPEERGGRSLVDLIRTGPDRAGQEEYAGGAPCKRVKKETRPLMRTGPRETLRSVKACRLGRTGYLEKSFSVSPTLSLVFVKLYWPKRTFFSS